MSKWIYITDVYMKVFFYMNQILINPPILKLLENLVL